MAEWLQGPLWCKHAIRKKQQGLHHIHRNLSICLRALHSAAADDHQLAALHGMPVPLLAQSIPPEPALPFCALQLKAERRSHAIRDKQRRLQAQGSALMDLLRPPGHILSQAVMPRKLYRALTSSRRRRRRTRVGHTLCRYPAPVQKPQ